MKALFALTITLGFTINASAKTYCVVHEYFKGNPIKAGKGIFDGVHPLLIKTWGGTFTAVVQAPDELDGAIEIKIQKGSDIAYGWFANTQPVKRVGMNLNGARADAQCTEE